MEPKPKTHSTFARRSYRPGTVELPTGAELDALRNDYLRTHTVTRCKPGQSGWYDQNHKRLPAKRADP